MTQATVHTRSEALELVAINLARFGHEAPQTLTAIDAGFRKLLGQIEQLCAARAQELARAEAALRSADEQSQAACRAAVQRAEAEKVKAEAARRLTIQATDTNIAASRRLAAETDRNVARGLFELRQLGDAVDRYTADGKLIGGLGGTAITGATSAAPSPGGSLDAALSERGMELVDVAAAAYTDNPVLDFNHGAGPSDYRWLVEKWDSVIGPGVAAGMTREDFEAMDNASGNKDMRRLAVGYDMMLGSEAIVLDRLPDGSFDVVSGRHRLDAAKELGIRHLPAKVR